MQPQTIMQALFSSTKHLINPLTVSVEMKSWCVPNVLCCLWTFINISVYERELWKLFAQLPKCRKDLVADTTPRSSIIDYSRSFSHSDRVKYVLEIFITGGCHQVPLFIHQKFSSLCFLTLFTHFHFFFFLFDEMPEPDVVSWNVVIDDLVKNGSFDEVLAVVNEMCWNGVEPNAVTLLGLVSCSLKMGDFGLGKLIHLYILKRGIYMSENLGNGLIDMYAKFGDMESAEKLFDGMQMKTVFSWTSLLDGFIQKGELGRASVVFYQMPKDTTAWNVMLNGYSEACDMSSAERIFRAMPDRDIVSWNSMILGYTRNKKYMKTLELLREMLWFGLKPDRITLVRLFSVCGYAGVLHIGEVIHSFMEKQNVKEEEVTVALLDMYSKCGDPEKALTVFYAIRRKSVLAWTNMIVGLAMNGLANEALMLFHQMCDEGTGPNEITFLGVLCACSYAGLVNEGKWLFNAMRKVHGITPRSEHYGCMVDLLGRAGLLKEAEMFIQDMPEKADAGIWGALLGACRMHGEVQMGEKIAKIVTQMDPYHSGRYILLSNIYAAENRWLDAEKVRKKMKTEGIHKTPGFSLVEMKGEMHQFIVGNHS